MGAPEKQVERDIMRALALVGCHVTKTSQPRASMITPGLPDLYVTHPRLRLRAWIEVKGPKGRLSPAQMSWHEAERAAGGTVVVAHSAHEALEALALL